MVCSAIYSQCFRHIENLPIDLKCISICWFLFDLNIVFYASSISPEAATRGVLYKSYL